MATDRNIDIGIRATLDPAGFKQMQAEAAKSAAAAERMQARLEAGRQVFAGFAGGLVGGAIASVAQSLLSSLGQVSGHVVDTKSAMEGIDGLMVQAARAAGSFSAEIRAASVGVVSLANASRGELQQALTRLGETGRNMIEQFRFEQLGPEMYSFSNAFGLATSEASRLDAVMADLRNRRIDIDEAADAVQRIGESAGSWSPLLTATADMIGQLKQLQAQATATAAAMGAVSFGNRIDAAFDMTQGVTDRASAIDRLRGQLQGMSGGVTPRRSGGGRAPSGGSSGPSASQRVMDTLRFEAEQLRRTATEQEVYNNLRQAGVGIESALGQQIAAATRANAAAEAAMRASRQETEAMQRSLERMADTGADAFAGILQQIARGGSAMEALRAQALRLMDTFIEMGARSLFGGILGGGGGSLFGGFLGGSGVPALATGTNMVTRGGLAMLHAGEAVVPARHAGPFRGEAAPAMRSGDMVVNVINNTDGQVSRRRSRGPDGGAIETIVIGATNKAVAQGRIDAMTSRYGARSAVVTR